MMVPFQTLVVHSKRSRRSYGSKIPNKSAVHCEYEYCTTLRLYPTHVAFAENANHMEIPATFERPRFFLRNVTYERADFARDKVAVDAEAHTRGRMRRRSNPAPPRREKLRARPRRHPTRTFLAATRIRPSRLGSHQSYAGVGLHRRRQPIPALPGRPVKSIMVVRVVAETAGSANPVMALGAASCPRPLLRHEAHISIGLIANASSSHSRFMSQARHGDKSR